MVLSIGWNLHTHKQNQSSDTHRFQIRNILRLYTCIYIRIAQNVSAKVAWIFYCHRRIKDIFKGNIMSGKNVSIATCATLHVFIITTVTSFTNTKSSFSKHEFFNWTVKADYDGELDWRLLGIFRIRFFELSFHGWFQCRSVYRHIASPWKCGLFHVSLPMTDLGLSYLYVCDWTIDLEEERAAQNGTSRGLLTPHGGGLVLILSRSLTPSWWWRCCLKRLSQS